MFVPARRVGVWGGQDRLGAPSPQPGWAARGGCGCARMGVHGQRVFGQGGAAFCITDTLWGYRRDAGPQISLLAAAGALCVGGCGISGGFTLLASLHMHSVTGGSASSLMNLEGHLKLHADCGVPGKDGEGVFGAVLCSSILALAHPSVPDMGLWWAWLCSAALGEH